MDECGDKEARPAPRWKLGREECEHLVLAEKRRQSNDCGEILVEMQQCGLKMLEEAQTGRGVSFLEFVLDCGKRVRGG